MIFTLMWLTPIPLLDYQMMKFLLLYIILFCVSNGVLMLKHECLPFTYNLFELSCFVSYIIDL